MTTLPGDASTLHDDFGDESAGAPDPGTPAAKAIEGRSLTQIAWSRLKRDRVAMAAGIVIAVLVLIAIFAPMLASLSGNSDPNQSFIGLHRPRHLDAAGLDRRHQLPTTCWAWSR